MNSRVICFLGYRGEEAYKKNIRTGTEMGDGEE
jgi:hypothetical protein